MATRCCAGKLTCYEKDAFVAQCRSRCEPLSDVVAARAAATTAVAAAAAPTENNVSAWSCRVLTKGAGYLYNAAYVIHRPVDHTRWATFQDHARRAGVHAHRFEAVDKNRMDLVKLVKANMISKGVAKRIRRMPWEQGAYACTISHNKLWRKLVREADRPCDQFLIFEDDSVIPEDFHYRLEKAMEVVPADWDLLYLNHNRLVGVNLTGDVWLKPTEEYVGMGANALLNAYLVRPLGLERILRFQHPINYTQSNDDNLRRHFRDFNAYFLIEKLVNTHGDSVRKDSTTSQTTSSAPPTRKPRSSR